MEKISKVKRLGVIQFPEFKGERIYMRKFNIKDGLPPDLKRWQVTVDQMLSGISSDGHAFIMVDQGEVQAGNPHRRPGLHIEGYWVEAFGRHGGGHRGISSGGWDTGPSWSHQDFSKDELTILASDVSACRAYAGVYYEDVQEGGDCSHVDKYGLKPINMEANIAYAGNVTMLHESLPIAHTTERTLVRLTLPGVAI